MNSIASNSSITDQKAALRKRMRAMGAPLGAAEREQAAQSLCRMLEQQPCWVQARLILAFIPMPVEVDVLPALERARRAGKRLALPRFRPVQKDYEICEVGDLTADLQMGAFNISEPAAHCPVVALPELDFVLVPGLAFDRTGQRLGRGKGFFDRMLSQVKGVTCGVTFDWQIVDQVPVEPHDIALDCLVTPTQWLDCRSRTI